MRTDGSVYARTVPFKSTKTIPVRRSATTATGPAVGGFNHAGCLLLGNLFQENGRVGKAVHDLRVAGDERDGQAPGEGDVLAIIRRVARLVGEF